MKKIVFILLLLVVIFSALATRAVDARSNNIKKCSLFATAGEYDVYECKTGTGYSCYVTETVAISCE